MSNRVGPVIMAHPVPRACLESSGYVHSFRTSNRTTGDTHYRYERTGQKQGNVEIYKETGEILPTRESLKDYRQFSGFSSVEEWQEAIKEVHGSLEESGYVYRIVRTGGEDE